MSTQSHESLVAEDMPPNPYKAAEKSQQLLDGLVDLGREANGFKFMAEESAKQSCDVVNKKNVQLIELCEDAIAGRLLRVSGPAAKVVNFTLEADREEGGRVIHMTLDPQQPYRQLEMYEERLFIMQGVIASHWQDEKDGSWRVSSELFGLDPQNVKQLTSLAAAGRPLIAVQGSGYIAVECNEHTSIEDVDYVKKNEREAALLHLRGRVNSGIIRLLRVIDREMTRKTAEDYTRLESTHNLRVLGKLAAQMKDHSVCDALNTAICRVLDRDGMVIVGGVTYDSTQKAAESVHGVTRGVLADVIPALPQDPSAETGPSLVLVDDYAHIDNPTYLPLKDVITFDY